MSIARRSIVLGPWVVLGILSYLATILLEERAGDNRTASANSAKILGMRPGMYIEDLL